MRTAVARVTAEVVHGKTALTELTYRAPARLHAMNTPGTVDVGAAWCMAGEYGGGLLGGDKTELHVRVQAGATLTLSTQGATKVYKTKQDGKVTQQFLHSTVEEGGLFLYTPDPILPYTDARYSQSQRFDIQPGGSVVVVDMCGSGREASGERWAFDSYSSRSMYFTAEPMGDGQNSSGTQHEPELALLLNEAVSLESCSRGRVNWAMDLAGVERNAFGSVVAIGPRAAEIVSKLKQAAAALSVQGGTRVANSVHEAAALFDLPELSGSVCMGVSPIGPEESGMVARLAAESPDDIVRIIHRCAQPLPKPSVCAGAVEV